MCIRFQRKICQDLEAFKDVDNVNALMVRKGKKVVLLTAGFNGGYDGNVCCGPVKINKRASVPSIHRIGYSSGINACKNFRAINNLVPNYSFLQYQRMHWWLTENEIKNLYATYLIYMKRSEEGLTTN